MTLFLGPCQFSYYLAILCSTLIESNKSLCGGPYLQLLWANSDVLFTKPCYNSVKKRVRFLIIKFNALRG